MRGSSWSALHRFSPGTLAALVWRAGERCTWCARVLVRGQHAIDHLVPRALGGSDDPSNLVLSCKKCNEVRGDDPSISIALLERMNARGRSVLDALVSVYVQTSTPIGRGSVANRCAKSIALAWFGSNIEKRRRVQSARRARMRAGARGEETPF